MQAKKDAQINLPRSTEVGKRIEQCRAEMAELKKLFRAVRAAELADQARRQRHPEIEVAK